MKKSVKKARHYIFEFVILFIAVVAGFLVDNWRERLADSRREKEYIRLLLSDFKSDTAKLTVLRVNLERRNAYIDTLLAEFSQENLRQKPKELHFYAMYISMIVSVSGVDPTDGALKLLENDGFRVIQNRSIIDSVFLYYEGIQRINNHYNELLESNHEMLNTMMKIFDFTVFTDQWNPLISMKFDRSKGNPRAIPQDLNEHRIFINELADQKRRTLRTLHHTIRVARRASRHIAFLTNQLDEMD